jgi:hypothetical protein
MATYCQMPTIEGKQPEPFVVSTTQQQQECLNNGGALQEKGGCTGSTTGTYAPGGGPLLALAVALAALAVLRRVQRAPPVRRRA